MEGCTVAYRLMKDVKMKELLGLGVHSILFHVDEVTNSPVRIT